jgi:hypothetical protein
MWMSSGGAALLFVIAMLLKETYQVRAGHAMLEEAPAD